MTLTGCSGGCGCKEPGRGHRRRCRRHRDGGANQGVLLTKMSMSFNSYFHEYSMSMSTLILILILIFMAGAPSQGYEFMSAVHEYEFHVDE